MENKVAVQKWTMSNRGNYVPSSGYATVYLVPEDAMPDLAAAIAAGKQSLFDFAKKNGREISDDEITDREPYERHSGALDYYGVTGVYTICYDCNNTPAMIPVQVFYEDICTRDDVLLDANVPDQESVLRLYKERAEHYKSLIQAFNSKEIGFSELKSAA